jgi:hypothetical protein
MMRSISYVLAATIFLAPQQAFSQPDHGRSTGARDVSADECQQSDLKGSWGFTFRTDMTSYYCSGEVSASGRFTSFCTISGSEPVHARAHLFVGTGCRISTSKVLEIDDIRIRLYGDLSADKSVLIGTAYTGGESYPLMGVRLRRPGLPANSP